LPGTCRIALDDDTAAATAQSWIQKIWDGECVYYVYPGENGACLTIVGATTDDVKLMSGECFPYEHEKNDYIGLHPDLNNLLDSSQVELVKTRLMHHFLRQYAYWIPPYNLAVLLSGLAPPLASKKCKHQFLDWQVLRADVTLNLTPLDTDSRQPYRSDADLLAEEIHDRLSDVVRALASLNRWEDAARLSQEIGDTFNDSAGNAYRCAAEAFQFAGNNEKSIEMFLKHLGRVGLGNINEEPHCDVLGNIFLVHHAIYEAAIVQHNQSSMVEQNTDVLLAIGYAALLRASGFKVSGQGDLFAEMLGVEPAALKSLLKDKFQRANRARKALLDLMKSQSIDEYKQSLSKLLRSNASLPMRPPFDTSISDDLLQFHAHNTCKSAREIAKKKTSLQACRCAHCGKWSSLEDDDNDDADGRYIKCQCDKVYYCNDTCQRSDWKRHQKACAWYVKNKDLKCSACGKVGESKSTRLMKQCPCHEESYCGKSCHVADWKEHKKVCAWHLAKEQGKKPAAV
jgi:MYND finger